MKRDIDIREDVYACVELSRGTTFLLLAVIPARTCELLDGESTTVSAKRLCYVDLLFLQKTEFSVTVTPCADVSIQPITCELSDGNIFSIDNDASSHNMMRGTATFTSARSRTPMSCYQAARPCHCWRRKISCT